MNTTLVSTTGPLSCVRNVSTRVARHKNKTGCKMILSTNHMSVPTTETLSCVPKQPPMFAVAAWLTDTRQLTTIKCIVCIKN